MRIVVHRLGRGANPSCISKIKPRAKPAAVVTSANPLLQGNAQPDHWLFAQYAGCNVDAAVRKAAGPDLETAVKPLTCPVGSAVSTFSFDLKTFDFIVHTCTPKRGTNRWRSLLSSAVSSTVAVAIEHGAKSLVLPALGCGVQQLSPREAAPIILNAAVETARRDTAEGVAKDEDKRRHFQLDYLEIAVWDRDTLISAFCNAAGELVAVERGRATLCVV